MRTRPLISLAAMTGLVDAIQAAGADVDELLRSLGLGRARFADANGFIASSDYVRLLEETARATGDDCFGLHFGERFQPKNIGPLMYVVLNSPTIAVAFENVGRYMRVHNEAAEVSFVVEGRFAYARHVLAHLPGEAPRQANDCAMAVWLNTLRLMAGSQWTPVEVQLAHPAPSDRSEYLRVFGAPVSFGHETNAMIVEREFTERQVPAADARLYPILKRYLEDVLKEMPREDGLLAAVRKVVGESMRGGDPTLTQVASKLAMGPRTLQRRLKGYGVDFKALVDDTRRRFALSYLRDRKHTLMEIAYLLGYAEASAFDRAFKRWTGSTPSGYRRDANEVPSGHEPAARLNDRRARPR